MATGAFPIWSAGCGGWPEKYCTFNLDRASGQHELSWPCFGSTRAVGWTPEDIWLGSAFGPHSMGLVTTVGCLIGHSLYIFLLFCSKFSGLYVVLFLYFCILVLVLSSLLCLCVVDIRLFCMHFTDTAHTLVLRKILIGSGAVSSDFTTAKASSTRWWIFALEKAGRIVSYVYYPPARLLVTFFFLFLFIWFYCGGWRWGWLWINGVIECDGTTPPADDVTPALVLLMYLWSYVLEGPLSQGLLCHVYGTCAWFFWRVSLSIYGLCATVCSDDVCRVHSNVTLVTHFSDPFI